MIEMTELLFNLYEAYSSQRSLKITATNYDSQRALSNFFDSIYVFVFYRVDEINEKMYDFEANKRNNLIFYGIANETRETQPKLLQKATKLLPELPHDENDMRE